MICSRRAVFPTTSHTDLRDSNFNLDFTSDDAEFGPFIHTKYVCLAFATIPTLISKPWHAKFKIRRLLMYFSWWERDRRNYKSSCKRRYLLVVPPSPGALPCDSREGIVCPGIVKLRVWYHSRIAAKMIVGSFSPLVVEHYCGDSSERGNGFSRSSQISNPHFVIPLDQIIRVIIETWSRKLRAKYFVSPTPKSCPKYCGGLTPNSRRYLLSPGAISGVRP